MALQKIICREHTRFISGLLNLKRVGPVCCGIHGTVTCKRTEKEISSEPIKFTSSAANIPSKFIPKESNKYEPLFVFSSVFVFMLYFLYLREENDLDEMIYKPIPVLEEFHLTQTIPEMKAKGLDTRQLELRLQELMDQRLAKEKPTQEVV